MANVTDATGVFIFDFANTGKTAQEAIDWLTRFDDALSSLGYPTYLGFNESNHEEVEKDMGASLQFSGAGRWTYEENIKAFANLDGDDYIVWEDESELPKLLQKYPLFNSCYPPLSKSGEKWGELKAGYTYKDIQVHNQSLEYSNNSPLTLDDAESETSVQSENNRATTNNSSNNCHIISDIERQELPRKMAQAGYSDRTINAFIELVDEYCGYTGDLNDIVVKNIEQHISDTLSKILTS